jgi:hypothetical protein
LISKKIEKEIVFESSVLAWIRIRIRIELKCWIPIRIESIRIPNPGLVMIIWIMVYTYTGDGDRNIPVPVMLELFLLNMANRGEQLIRITAKHVHFATAPILQNNKMTFYSL